MNRDKWVDWIRPEELAAADEQDAAMLERAAGYIVPVDPAELNDTECCQ